MAGVDPAHLRRILTVTFQQRRKTVRNSLKKLAKELADGDTEKAKAMLDAEPLPLPNAVKQAIDDGDNFAANQELPTDWALKRPEELSPGQFVELTRLFFGPADGTIDESRPLGQKVWRKLKHGT